MAKHHSSELSRFISNSTYGFQHQQFMLDVYSDINDSHRFEAFLRKLLGLQSDYGNPNALLFRIQVTNNGEELRVLMLGPLQEQQQASVVTTIGASITQGRPTVDGSDIMTIECAGLPTVCLSRGPFHVVAQSIAMLANAYERTGRPHEGGAEETDHAWAAPSSTYGQRFSRTKARCCRVIFHQEHLARNFFVGHVLLPTMEKSDIKQLGVRYIAWRMEQWQLKDEW
jgi:hypothetical protein